MELDTSMAGLDPGGDTVFQPGPCVVTEFKRAPVQQRGQKSEYSQQIIAQDDVDDWIDEKGRFVQEQGRVSVRWIFACTIPTALDSDGNFLSSSETLELALSKESFTKLTQRYHFSGQVLDAWRYRSSAGCGARNVEYDETGAIKCISFVISLRLSGSFASVIAINHSLQTHNTTVLALRVRPYDQTLLQQSLELHDHLIGHALLIPTVLIEISLATNMLYMQKIRQELSAIEKATGQHGWLQIPATDAPAHDSELSRLGHAAKIHISLSHRRLDSIKCWMQLIKQTLSELDGSITQSFAAVASSHGATYTQWISNIELMINFRQVDLAYNERRADNQTTAIYGLLSQRDNMVGVSVAIESKKISEASKRDGSALKSLTVLTAVFFPATYIATLFALPTFSQASFWLYWAVVIPLTLVIFGSWACWTLYRQRRIAMETIRGEVIHGDVEVDPERVFPVPEKERGGKVGGSGSGLVATMRQIRQHTRHLGSGSGAGLEGRVPVPVSVPVPMAVKGFGKRV